MLFCELFFKIFALWVIVVFVGPEVVWIIFVMTVYTVAIFSTFDSSGKALTVEFHAFGVSAIAPFTPIYFL